MHPFIRFVNVDIPTFQLFSYCGVLFALMLYLFSGKYNLLFRWSVLHATGCITFFAALGARILSALTLTLIGNHSFAYNLLHGGAVFYGGLIGGALSLILWCKVRKVFFLDYADVFCSLLPLCQSVGRIGCYFNGCCYGRFYDGLLSVPFNVDGRLVTVFPTWFIESGFCLILTIFFQLFCHTRTSGFRLSYYLFAYSLFRFILEFYRGDKIRGYIGFFSVSQLLSIILFLLSIVIFFRSKRENMTNYLFN